MCPGIRVPTGGNSILKDERGGGNTDQGTQMASVAERLGVSIREVTEGPAELPVRPVTLCTAPRRPLSFKFPVIIYRPGPSEAQLSLLFSSQQKYSKAKKKKVRSGKLDGSLGRATESRAHDPLRAAPPRGASGGVPSCRRTAGSARAPGLEGTCPSPPAPELRSPGRIRL